MNVRPQGLERLLVLDAKILLLINDQKTEIVELDRLGQQRMRADDDFNLAVA